MKPPCDSDDPQPFPLGVWTVGVLGLVVIGAGLRLATMPPAPDVDDSILFVRGVVRYSIAETRPHWPGYPVYIWAGKLMALASGNPVRGLHLVSIFASALLALPLAIVTREWARSLATPEWTAGFAGWGAAIAWLVTPMAWVTGSQIVSDPLGLLFGMTVLVLSLRAERTNRRALWLGAAALGGLMIGVRLVNVTMLGPLVWAAWRFRRERWLGSPAPLLLVMALLAGAAPWLGWLAWHEGAAILWSGRVHVRGHFERWGESLLTDRDPSMRPWRALRTVAIYGLGAGSPGNGWPRVLAGVSWLAVLAKAAVTIGRREWRNPVTRVFALWAVPNLVYIFLGHDVAYPRYMLSAVSVLSIVAGLAAAGGRTGVAILAIAVVSTTAVSGPLALLQRREPPVEYRAAHFLAQRPRAAVAVADAPALPFFLGDAGLLWSVVHAFDVPRVRAQWEAEGRTVFTTAPPPQEPSEWRPVAHFCRDPLIDPRLGHDLWLFAPVSSAETGLLVQCRAE